MNKVNLLLKSGLLLILTAFSIVIFNVAVNNRALEVSEKVCIQLIKREPVMEFPVYKLNKDIPMPVMTIDGKEYIGVLSIPALQVELPVLSECSNSLLKLSPCRFAGSIYRGDMVICAYNYASQFGRLHHLHYGDSVTFQDIDGNLFHFIVSEIEILSSGAVEDLTDGMYPLSLVTCDLSRSNRFTVRLQLLDDNN